MHNTRMNQLRNPFRVNRSGVNNRGYGGFMTQMTGPKVLDGYAPGEGGAFLGSDEPDYLAVFVDAVFGESMWIPQTHH